MLEFIPIFEQLHFSNTPYAIVLVTQTWASAPRPKGSMMIISQDQKIYGSVSGGCIEKDVVVEALHAIQQSKSKLLNFGVSQETAWNTGLSCGGTIELLVIPSSILNIPFQKLTPGSVFLFPLDSSQNCEYIEDPNSSIPIIQELFQQRKHSKISIDGKNYFALLLPPKSKLFIIGAVHLAAELVFFAQYFDFETHLIDPRSFFSKNTEFKIKPDFISTDWPEQYFKKIHPGPFDYAVFLSHDPKIDDQGLEILLPSNIAYLGALGGKKSKEKRIERLLQKGFTASEIEKIKAPVGLKINSSTAKEIALSIMAEIIAVKNMHLE